MDERTTTTVADLIAQAAISGSIAGEQIRVPEQQLLDELARLGIPESDVRRALDRAVDSGVFQREQDEIVAA